MNKNKRYLSNKLIKGLEDARKRVIALIEKSRGNESRCGCEKLSDVAIYADSWILPALNDVLDEEIQ